MIDMKILREKLMSLFMKRLQLYHKDGSSLSSNEKVEMKDIVAEEDALGTKEISESLELVIDKNSGVDLFSEDVYHPIGMSDEEAIRLRDILCELYGIPESNMVKSA